MSNQEEKNQKIKTIIIATVGIVIAILFITWLVGSAIRPFPDANNQSSDSTPISVSQSSEKPATAAPSSASTSSPADQYNNSSNSSANKSNSSNSSDNSTPTNTTAPIGSSSNIPSTSASNPTKNTSSTNTPSSTKSIPSAGPQDIFFTIVLIGVATILASYNFQLAKRQ